MRNLTLLSFRYGFLVLFAALPTSPSVAASGASTARHEYRGTNVEETIKELEQRWAEAFVEDDYSFIERIVSPEFKLVLHEGSYISVPRSKWMANLREWDIKSFDIEVLDVAVLGDAATVTFEGQWTVYSGDHLIRNDRFFATDIWVRRDGKWMVVRRHSQTIE